MDQPHRFHCITCGCSLYYLEDLNRNECEPCLDWLARAIVWFHSRSTRLHWARG